QFAAELVERVAGPGIDLQLLLLQLEFERLHRVRLGRRGLIRTQLARARLPLAPARHPGAGAVAGSAIRSPSPAPPLRTVHPSASRRITTSLAPLESGLVA